MLVIKINNMTIELKKEYNDQNQERFWVYVNGKCMAHDVGFTEEQGLEIYEKVKLQMLKPKPEPETIKSETI